MENSKRNTLRRVEFHQLIETLFNDHLPESKESGVLLKAGPRAARLVGVAGCGPAFSSGPFTQFVFASNKKKLKF